MKPDRTEEIRAEVLRRRLAILQDAVELHLRFPNPDYSLKTALDQSRTLQVTEEEWEAHVNA